MSDVGAAAEAKIVLNVYAAINRNDPAAAVKAFDAEAEWSVPEEFPGGGTSRGRAAIEAHLAKSRENWAEGSCEPERLIFVGDKIVAIVHVHVRLKNETDWREGRIGDVFTFRNGKVTSVRVFAEPEQAMKWIGMEDPTTDPAVV